MALNNPGGGFAGLLNYQRLILLQQQEIWQEILCSYLLFKPSTNMKKQNLFKKATETGDLIPILKMELWEMFMLVE